MSLKRDHVNQDKYNLAYLKIKDRTEQSFGLPQLIILSRELYGSRNNILDWENP